MNEPIVSSWGPTSKAAQIRRRWQKAGVGLLAAMLASPGVWAQAEPSKAPAAVPPAAVPPAAVPPAAVPPAGGPVSPAAPNPASADDQLRALREDVARQSAELAAQRAELERLSGAQAAKSADALAAASGSDADAYQDKLVLYGFMDMGFQKLWLGPHAIANVIAESTATTFVLGNVNLYVDAHPLEQWRALAEVRLTTYPNGEFTLGPPGTPVTRTSTRVQDTNSASGPWAALNWGGIVLERAQIEWSAAEWFKVVSGYWFTPYGIWNIDHGSPTLIGLNEPQFVVFETFPARQLGVDITGVFHATPWDIEYHAYVSNGRTPGQQDLTNDKMIGGRLVLRTSEPFDLAVGGSGFYGRMSDTPLVFTSYAPITATREEVMAMKEVGLSADVSADLGPLRVRSEFVWNERRYDEGKRPRTTSGGFAADRRTWSAYGLVAYQLPWAGLEPYAYLEYNRGLSLGSAEPRTGDFSQVVTMSSVGLNIHFTPATQLKMQYAHDVFSDSDELGRDFTGTNIDLFSSRLVVSF
jgi:hypothetical protein